MRSRSSRRRDALVAVLLLAPALAGCLAGSDPEGDPVLDQGQGARPTPGPDRFAMERPPCPPTPTDCSREWLNLTITPRTDAPWQVGVPLPVHPNGTTAEDWFNGLVNFEPTSARLESVGNGTFLVLTGRGRAHVSAFAMATTPDGEPCCAEDYLRASFTVLDEEGRPMLRADRGAPLTVQVTHEAHSNHCSLDTVLEAEPDRAPRWLAFEEEGPSQAVCA